jgi:hypothetical protein
VFVLDSIPTGLAALARQLHSLALSLVRANDGFSLKLLNPRSGALCLDGTPGGLYLRPSKTHSPNWIIHFQGGGWCIDEQDCLKRSKSGLGSSAKWPKQGVLPNDGGPHGFLSPDPAVNPTFHDWNMVHINYCDGASFAGFKQNPIQVQGKNLYKRWKANSQCFKVNKTLANEAWKRSVIDRKGD